MNSNLTAIEAMFRGNVVYVIFGGCRDSDFLFYLVDCDEYLLAAMACDSCMALCLHFERVGYRWAEVVSGNSESVANLGLATPAFEESICILLHADEEDECALPVLAGVPTGYIFCGDARIGARAEDVWPHDSSTLVHRKFR